MFPSDQHIEQLREQLKKTESDVIQIMLHEARHSLMDSIHETESDEELVDHITIHDLAQWDPTMVGRMLADKVQLDSGLSVQIVDCSSTVEFACFIEGKFVGNVDADGFTTEDLIDSPLYPKILEDLRAIFPMISE
jgi:hypothetical protein